LVLEKTQPLSKTSSSVPLLNHSLQLPEGSPIPRNHSHSVLCHPIALHKCSALSFLSFWPLPPSPRQDQALRFTNLPVSTPRSKLYPCFISPRSFRLEVRWLRWFVERGLLRDGIEEKDGERRAGVNGKIRVYEVLCLVYSVKKYKSQQNIDYKKIPLARKGEKKNPRESTKKKNHPHVLRYCIKPINIPISVFAFFPFSAPYSPTVFSCFLFFTPCSCFLASLIPVHNPLFP